MDYIDKHLDSEKIKLKGIIPNNLGETVYATKPREETQDIIISPTESMNNKVLDRINNSIKNLNELNVPHKLLKRLGMKASKTGWAGSVGKSVRVKRPKVLGSKEERNYTERIDKGIKHSKMITDLRKLDGGQFEREMDLKECLETKDETQQQCILDLIETINYSEPVIEFVMRNGAVYSFNEETNMAWIFGKNGDSMIGPLDNEQEEEELLRTIILLDLEEREKEDYIPPSVNLAIDHLTFSSERKGLANDFSRFAPKNLIEQY